MCKALTLRQSVSLEWSNSSPNAIILALDYQSHQYFITLFTSDSPTAVPGDYYCEHINFLITATAHSSRIGFTFDKIYYRNSI